MQHGSIEITDGDCFDRRFETKHITQPIAVTFSYVVSDEKTGETFMDVFTQGRSFLQFRYASKFVESPGLKGSPVIRS